MPWHSFNVLPLMNPTRARAFHTEKAPVHFERVSLFKLSYFQISFRAKCRIVRRTLSCGPARP
jgi:hypothetical protein